MYITTIEFGRGRDKKRRKRRRKSGLRIAGEYAGFVGGTYLGGKAALYATKGIRKKLENKDIALGNIEKKRLLSEARESLSKNLNLYRKMGMSPQEAISQGRVTVNGQRVSEHLIDTKNQMRKIVRDTGTLAGGSVLGGSLGLYVASKPANNKKKKKRRR